jgi:hypothetical protein
MNEPTEGPEPRATKRERSFDGALFPFRARRIRAPVASALLVFVWVVWLYRRCHGDPTVLVLLIAGTLVALLMSADLRADVRRQARRALASIRMLFAPPHASRRRTMQGRVRLLSAVREPGSGTDVAAYWIAHPSPRERWYTPVLRLVFVRASPFYERPADMISTAVGHLVVDLEDGRHARLETAAVVLVDRRRVRWFERRRVIVRDGDRVELSGIAAFDEATRTYVFDGANDSVVRLALLGRAPRSELVRA